MNIGNILSHLAAASPSCSRMNSLTTVGAAGSSHPLHRGQPADCCDECTTQQLLGGGLQMIPAAMSAADRAAYQRGVDMSDEAVQGPLYCILHHI
jgi:hypothetical protein